MSDGTNDDVGHAARASLLYEPTDDLSILLSGDFAHQGGKGRGATARKTCASLGRAGAGVLRSRSLHGGIGICRISTFPSASLRKLTTATWTAIISVADSTSTGRRASAPSASSAAIASRITRYKGSGTSWLLLEDQHPTQASAELRLASSGHRPIPVRASVPIIWIRKCARIANSENARAPQFQRSAHGSRRLDRRSLYAAELRADGCVSPHRRRFDTPTKRRAATASVTR